MHSLAEIRQQFPAMRSETAFLENAGGSQIAGFAIDRVAHYFRESYVQLGASYTQSLVATEIVADAHAVTEKMMGAGEAGRVVLGASSTALCFMLADCFARSLKPGAVIVVAENGHEANINPWLKLADRGLKIRWWKVDPEVGDCTLDGLAAVLSDEVALVCCCHVSNLLGGILDIAEVTRMAHGVGAKTVIDGVAYAPHHQMLCEEWGVDFYFYSLYKVFGPHMGAMYGRKEAWEVLEGPNHFFMANDYFPGKFEIGGASHEGCAAILGAHDYLDWLGKGSLKAAFETIASLETPLMKRFVEFIENHPDYELVGGKENRVSTISFRHKRLAPEEVVALTDEANVAIRWGHMYSYRLCESLKIPPDEGVVRASPIHYNSMEEIERLIAVLQD